MLSSTLSVLLEAFPRLLSAELNRAVLESSTLEVLEIADDRELTRGPIAVEKLDPTPVTSPRVRLVRPPIRVRRLRVLRPFR